MITFKQTGDFSKTTNFLNNNKVVKLGELNKYGRMGVDALSRATPVDTGLTANSWDYEISQENGKITIYWINKNVNNGVNIAVIIQYGHGTGTGGYVQGIDYINPAMKHVFENIAESAWREVTSK